MEAVLFALAVGGAMLIYFFVRNDEVAMHRYAWQESNINSYRITLRYDKRSLNFDGEILGDGTTITVIDGEITDIVGSHVEQSTYR